MSFLEFHKLLAASRWGMRVKPWLKLIENMTLIPHIFQMRYDTDEFPWVLWTFGWIQMRYEGEPMGQINWKYDPSNTEGFRWVQRAIGWIQMRYEGEPMVQINWKYYPSNTEGFRWVQRAFGWIQMRYEVNPWLKLIGHIIWAKLMSFVEFYGLLAGFR